MSKVYTKEDIEKAFLAGEKRGGYMENLRNRISHMPSYLKKFPSRQLDLEEYIKSTNYDEI